jgi:hypothetical protein
MRGWLGPGVIKGCNGWFRKVDPGVSPWGDVGFRSRNVEVGQEFFYINKFRIS